MLTKKNLKTVVMAGLVLLGGCQATVEKSRGLPVPVARSEYASVTPAELRDLLAEMARAHDQKVQLAFYVSVPFVGPGVEAPFRGFYSHMGEVHKALGEELRGWAKLSRVDLTYKPATDTVGEAQKIMEARQETMVRSGKGTDFVRDSLLQMYTDYEWQLSLSKALLAKTQDPLLKNYLEHSIKAHEAGSAEIVGLLKKFKPA